MTKDVPEWMTPQGLQTLQANYLLPGETPRDMYWRIAKAAASQLTGLYGTFEEDHFFPAEYFFDILWKGWLCPASPILANMGTDRGLPISCFLSTVDDSLHDIFMGAHELAMLSKAGGGTAIDISDLRPRGSIIGQNGEADGIVSWCKLYDTTISVVSQGAVRRGATALYLDVDHPDIEEFLQIRRTDGDPRSRCLNINHAVKISGDFMKRVQDGDKKARKLWTQILDIRTKTGEPYLFFQDNVDAATPQFPNKPDYKVRQSNLCNEIYLHTDSENTAVCCLSSMNLDKWDEWKNTNAVRMATYFLDGVMSEFIQKAKQKIGLEKAVQFADKSRALGLGVLGYHTLLQKKGFPFGSYDAYTLNNEIFSHLQEQSLRASEDMGLILGCPDWCQNTGHWVAHDKERCKEQGLGDDPNLIPGKRPTTKNTYVAATGRRNSHLLAIAPTFTNSIISGGVSAGIEPIAGNTYTSKTAAGTFVVVNPIFKKLLEDKGIENISDIIDSVNANEGSVQHLDFLTPHEKEVFLTAREINQMDIIKQAAQRQKYIDQGQSVNLFFPANAPKTFINEVHLAAHELGLKGLYYLKSSSAIQGDVVSGLFDKNNCKACEG